MRTQRLLAAALVLCSLGTAGAQVAYLPGLAGGDYRIPVTNLKAQRLAGTLLQKYDFSCGSAAVATLLTHHYGLPISEREVFEQMYAQGDQRKIHREGFSLLDMKSFLASRGFQADGFEQPLDKLVEAGVPAIALVNESGYHHFVVIKGLRGGRVLVGDPAKGTRAVPRAEFEKSWIGGLLFVVYNHMDSAKFNQASDWRAAPSAPVGVGLDRAGLTRVAVPKFGPGQF